MEHSFITNVRIRKFSNDQLSDVEDQLAVEEPL